jgi:hypothetical protein
MSALDGLLLLWLIVLSGYTVWKGKTGPLGFTGPPGEAGVQGPPGPAGAMPSDADIERVIRRMAFDAAKEPGKTDEDGKDVLYRHMRDNDDERL